MEPLAINSLDDEIDFAPIIDRVNASLKDIQCFQARDKAQKKQITKAGIETEIEKEVNAFVGRKSLEDSMQIFLEFREFDHENIAEKICDSDSGERIIRKCAFAVLTEAAIAKLEEWLLEEESDEDEKGDL